ncbi:MAG: hypothetical protein H7338_06770, partial [Candidatus Sericytochromatia bacterium]|nr:hypothetical protein [Candidatus Sericytochromatia bacterium]
LTPSDALTPSEPLAPMTTPAVAPAEAPAISQPQTTPAIQPAALPTTQEQPTMVTPAPAQPLNTAQSAPAEPMSVQPALPMGAPISRQPANAPVMKGLDAAPVMGTTSGAPDASAPVSQPAMAVPVTAPVIAPAVSAPQIPHIGPTSRRDINKDSAKPAVRPPLATKPMTTAAKPAVKPAAKPAVKPVTMAHAPVKPPIKPAAKPPAPKPAGSTIVPPQRVNTAGTMDQHGDELLEAPRSKPRVDPMTAAATTPTVVTTTTTASTTSVATTATPETTIVTTTTAPTTTVVATTETAATPPAPVMVAERPSGLPSGELRTPAMARTFAPPFRTHVQLLYNPFSYRESLPSQELQAAGSITKALGAEAGWRLSDPVELTGSYLYNDYRLTGDEANPDRGLRSEHHGRMMGYYVLPISSQLEVAAGAGALLSSYATSGAPADDTRTPDLFDSNFQRLMLQAEAKVGYQPVPSLPLTLTASAGLMPWGRVFQSSAMLPDTLWGVSYSAGARYSIMNVAVEARYRGQQVFGDNYQQGNDMLQIGLGYEFR